MGFKKPPSYKIKYALNVPIELKAHQKLRHLLFYRQYTFNIVKISPWNSFRVIQNEYYVDTVYKIRRRKKIKNEDIKYKNNL